MDEISSFLRIRVVDLTPAALRDFARLFPRRQYRPAPLNAVAVVARTRLAQGLTRLYGVHADRGDVASTLRSDHGDRWTSGGGVSELERKIDARQVLRAYQRIVETGERDGESHRLGDLVAAADFDGYTVTVSDEAVTVRVLFHSRVAIETGNPRALESFVKRLDALVGAG